VPTPHVPTLYRRPLPADAIAFSSSEGRRLFAEALAAGGLDAYFPLAEQFHTQADPAFCGLGSLVVALNALGVDPGRLWKGPWRWFAEDLLDCCVPLDEVRRRGLDLDELACLARCNGADVELRRADVSGIAAFRRVIGGPHSTPHVVVAAYDRRGLGQTGAGHFSPIAGYHAARDLALVLDVARFKYPPHWVAVERLWESMQSLDDTTGKPRGYMMLRSRAGGVALGFTLSCANEGWPSLYARIDGAIEALGGAADLASLARAIAPLVANVQLRVPQAPTHAEALEEARRELRRLPAYATIAAAIGGEGADVATLLLCALEDRLSPGQRELLKPNGSRGGALQRDIETLHAQLSAITHLPR
jgi:glutathione gamma-glutamylcysteinyltransferase